MQHLNFNVPVNINMGEGVTGKIGITVEKAGGRTLIVTGADVIETGLHKRIEKMLAERGVDSIIFSGIGPDSTCSVVDSIVKLASSSKARTVLGIGGVRTMSIARAAAILSPAKIRIDDYLDGTRAGVPALPFIGIPSTCRDPFMFKDSMMLTDSRNRRCMIVDTNGVLPHAVFIDPTNAETMPPATFIFTILDTLMYAIEGYMSVKSNFLSESLFLKAVSAVVSSEKRLDENSADKEAFEKAAKAGLVTSMGLSMAGPGLGAALSMIISSRFRIPRALVSAVLLPHILEYGLQVYPEKVARLAPILNEPTEGLNVVEAAQRVIDTIRHRVGLRRVPMRFSEFGVTMDDLGNIAETVKSFDFITQLPAPLSSDDIIGILKNGL